MTSNGAGRGSGGPARGLAPAARSRDAVALARTEQERAQRRCNRHDEGAFPRPQHERARRRGEQAGAGRLASRGMWLQREITLRPRPRGFHLVTREVLEALPELAGVRAGLLHLFIRHTSASLTLNENA
ncbi:MAG TPA: YjbQ family protein, partial [Solirubrobacteraceae bacterium]|nr:YjbQ family protein [Solirubrobacteraceae bacterium]